MRYRFVALVLVCCALTRPAAAQDYPNRPIHLIVPFLAGGGVDAAARIVAQKLSELLGQPVVVENRAGASGTIGATAAAKAAPDGYTILAGPGDLITTPSLMPKMPIDPLKDLVPITMVSSNPFVVVATANAPFRTMAELIAAARAKPGDIGYATPGNGTFNHVAAEWMASAANIKLQHIPYRGGAASANGIAAGDLPLGVLSPPVVQGLIDVGRIRVLALTGKTRPSFMPASWPTLFEAGLPVDAVFWVGLFAPAGTPPAIVSRLEQDMARVLQDPAVRKRMNDIGLEPGEAGQTALVERIRTETARYNAIIRETGIRAEN
ncbi:MAG: tripartite tricarboxylate transporter substrate-binding protein [Pseudomonadota bacterium]